MKKDEIEFIGNYGEESNKEYFMSYLKAFALAPIGIVVIYFIILAIKSL